MFRKKSVQSGKAEKKKPDIKLKSPVKISPATPIDKERPVVDKSTVSKRSSAIETLRGVRDIVPQEAPYWRWVYSLMECYARDYGFSWIDLPTIEPASLFIRAVGKQTDIVEKEMYRFTDQGGEDVVLRPEFTASAARAYVNHGMLNLPQPVKFFYYGQAFRYDRPQSGRYREFHQIGFETFGDEKPIVDAELIIVAWNLLNDLGLPAVVQMNSIGTTESRTAYREKLVQYYRSNRSKLCDDCKRRLTKNPLRLLDCKQEECGILRNDAPQILDSLDEESKNHFMRVLEYLDEMEIPYVLDPYLVRGLDYYNQTVFEFAIEGDDGRSQNALGGGGRYDGLVELIGGRPTPGVGFALGVERIVLALKSKEINPPAPEPPNIFMAQLGEAAKRRALVLFQECRRGGLTVAQAFVKDSLKVQMEMANKLKARFTLILGQKEVLDGTIVIRDMDSGVQEVVDQKKIVHEIRKKMATVISEPISSEIEPSLD